MIKIKKINNTPVNSNCYVITNSISNKCIIIDPGSEDNKDLLAYLTKKSLNPSWVILTHEHFDHCLGVNHLNKLYNLELICSEGTSQFISDPGLNFSAYWDEIQSFGISMKPRIVKDAEIVICDQIFLSCITTPGYSPGSICFSIDNHIFIVDTLLWLQYKTICKN